MKKILPVVFLILLTACTDYLDTELEGQFTTDTFFQTQDHALSAVNATYQIAAFNSTNNNLWVFGDLASDDTVKGGFDGDQSDITLVNDFVVNPDNGPINGIWQHYYEGITRANNVIYHVPNIDMDIDLRARIIGEAKFLRAYFYFHLSNIFGNIPLKTIPAFTPDELNVPLSLVENIYAQIEQDLVEAATTLPATYESVDLGRATKGAALGLLAKAYLFQEKWQLAVDTATQTESLGYSLTSLYRDNFKVETENNQESVFEIQHLTGQIPAAGTYLNQWFSPSLITGYFFNAPTQNFIDEFEVTQEGVVDPRLDYSVGREGNIWVNNQAFDPLWSPTTYLSKKHVQDPGENPIGDGDLNYTFMRFSEILLIKAEALNELGSTAQALVPLNLVRKRARESYLFDATLVGFGTIPANLLPEVSSTNASVVRDAIRHERRVELGLEFHRYFDIVRYGQAYAEQALGTTQFNYALHRYFPIPQSEKDSNTSL
ncbi:RagB/SusD family nutrient uptake outer membrane protein [Ulvibacterium marinum]|uniref:RagB/SusD family nutrient uptake outer membrane protein n=1 Tax=Ulvibacterium marinum TaxID=2419782 RepID=UPI0024945249|nr:RagB/SusD family nutrient uptake outer membrane protein [Ulvibacterium marinum]